MNRPRYAVPIVAIAVVALVGCSAVADRVTKAAEAAKYVAAHPNGKYTAYTNGSAAMMPTLPVGSELVVNVAAFQKIGPSRGDIVIFKPPVLSDAPFIKRVVGIPGDRVRIQQGRLYINGKAQSEPFVQHAINYDLKIDRYRLYLRQPGESSWGTLDPSMSANPPRAKWQSADRVPNGYYLVLGDNRNDSEDSHVFGLIARNALEGKVVEKL